MPKSTMGTITVLIFLAVLIILFGGDIKGGLLSGLVAGAAAAASFSYFKKKQDEGK